MVSIVLPTYVTKQPSTGKSVKFRPFTVKEEKSLLLSLQENDIHVVSNAIKDIVSECTFQKLNLDDIPYYDVEYIYLQIRAKSAGEILDLVGSCTCSEDSKTRFESDLSQVYISPEPPKGGTIQLKIPDTNYTINIRHPSIDDFVSSFEAEGDNAPEVVSNSIKSIYTDDELMDWSFEDKKEFVESMTTVQQKALAEFLYDMPKVNVPTKYKCSMCGKEHDSTISGFANFFV